MMYKDPKQLNDEELLREYREGLRSHALRLESASRKFFEVASYINATPSDYYSLTFYALRLIAKDTLNLRRYLREMHRRSRTNETLLDYDQIITAELLEEEKDDLKKGESK